MGKILNKRNSNMADLRIERKDSKSNQRKKKSVKMLKEKEEER